MAPLLILVALARVGGEAPGDLREIAAACAAAAHVGAAGKRDASASLRIFVEVSGAVLPKPRQGNWRELGNEAERKALADGAQPPNTEAVVRSTRAATLVSMYFQDPSGSWAHVVDYCFRPGGSLARLQGTYNTYTAALAGHAGVRRRRTIHFDDAGAAVKTEARAFDLETDRPLGDVAFSDEADPVYPALRALPFWDSLAPPAVAGSPEPDGVASTVREHLPTIKACYDRALKHTPNVGGKIVARFTIDDAGKVGTFAWQSDQMHSAAFNACAQQALEALRFTPAKGAPVTVTFPFVFNNGDAKVTVQPPSSNDGTTAAR
jgi:hypothetical protein